MDIRKLRKSDVKQLEYIENELFDNPFSEKSCMEELSLENRLYIGLFDENNMLGYAGASVAFEVADIIKVGVLKSEQGKGYGKMLLASLIEMLAKVGVAEIILEVEHQNYKAINLYLSFGFEEISERKNYYGENSHAKILRKELGNEN